MGANSAYGQKLDSKRGTKAALKTLKSRTNRKLTLVQIDFEFKQGRRDWTVIWEPTGREKPKWRVIVNASYMKYDFFTSLEPGQIHSTVFIQQAEDLRKQAKKED